MTGRIPRGLFLLLLVPLCALGQDLKSTGLPMPRASAMVRPVQAPPPTRSADAIKASIRPDLTIKQMRLEGDKAVHVLVANIGTGDASAFRMDMSGSGGRGTSIAYLPLRGTEFDGMKAGEEKWLVFETFSAPSTESTYPGKPAYVPIAELNWFHASVDVYAAAAGWGGGDPLSSLDHPQTRCTTATGCVLESDETNNSMSIKRTDMPAW